MWGCQIIPIRCTPMFLFSLPVQIKYSSTFFVLFYQVDFTHALAVVFLFFFFFEFRKNLRSPEKHVVLLYFLLVQSAIWLGSYVPLVGWDGVVSIVSCYGLDCWGIESHWERDFVHTSRSAAGPNKPPVQ